MVFEAVVFDLDGTLVDERSSWEWVHQHFGVDNDANLNAFLRGEFDDIEFMAADICLWQKAAGGPIHIDEIAEILESAPLMEGAGRLVDALHNEGVPMAIVSGGIDILAERVGEILGIEVVIANSLDVDDEGYLLGSGGCRVSLNDKASPADDALASLRCGPGAGAAVGNTLHDIGMFKVAGFGVAFAPLDDQVREAADVVVEEHDLGLVIEHLLPERRF